MQPLNICSWNCIFAFALTLTLILPSECYWKFPGMDKHSDSGKKEQEVFLETMKNLLQPGDLCNVQENESSLKDLNAFVKKQKSLDLVKKEFLNYKGKLCRYDITVCDSATTKCECNGNAQYEVAAKACRIRVGWPCTDDGTNVDQCVKDAACKPWEGSFSYDTESFPTANDFFTDPNKNFCRCSDNEDADCGAPGDDVKKAQTDLAARLQVNYSILCSSLVALVSGFYVMTNQRS